MTTIAAQSRSNRTVVNLVYQQPRKDIRFRSMMDERCKSFNNHFLKISLIDVNHQRGLKSLLNNRKGLLILNKLVVESFIEPTFLSPRIGKRRTFSEIPSTVGRMIRGLTNLTVTIGRTINSENVNGSLSRLITNRLVGVSESLMGWVERSVDDLPSIPRLDAQECMKRCICEAHNQPKKYGAVGLVIQLFFPPYLDSEDANKIVSKYQLAARYGRGENANCAAQYDGCMVNVLDLFQSAVNMIF
ncbi:hypothetical protein BLOT_011683 [Blomia tropicalis]|nr:hypothetical protein BLOT_011683 [Blomia tropicalis]